MGGEQGEVAPSAGEGGDGGVDAHQPAHTVHRPEKEGDGAAQPEDQVQHRPQPAQGDAHSQHPE